MYPGGGTNHAVLGSVSAESFVLRLWNRPSDKRHPDERPVHTGDYQLLHQPNHLWIHVETNKNRHLAGCITPSRLMNSS